MAFIEGSFTVEGEVKSCEVFLPTQVEVFHLNVNFGFNTSQYLLEPAQLCKSEQRPSSLPVGPVVASLGNQTPTPNSTGTKNKTPLWIVCNLMSLAIPMALY